MASLRLGEIVKVLAEGYGLPPGEKGVVEGFSVGGVMVGVVKWGRLDTQCTIPAFALQRVSLPQVEMIWNRIRHKEDMIARALKVWGVVSIELQSTEIAGEGFKVMVHKNRGDALSVRARSLSEAIKMAFTLGYFMRVSMRDVHTAKEKVLRKVEEAREAVRAL